jgi:hypothetical protein
MRRLSRKDFLALRKDIEGRLKQSGDFNLAHRLLRRHELEVFTYGFEEGVEEGFVRSAELSSNPDAIFRQFRRIRTEFDWSKANI